MHCSMSTHVKHYTSFDIDALFDIYTHIKHYTLFNVDAYKTPNIVRY